MTYYINYINTRDAYRGVELKADSIEDLINQLLFKKDIASVEEVVELEAIPGDVESKEDDFIDWITRNRI